MFRLTTRSALGFLHAPVPKEVDSRDRQIADLERQVARMTKRAERAEALVELQKKVSEILGIALPTTEEPKS